MKRRMRTIWTNFLILLSVTVIESSQSLKRSNNFPRCHPGMLHIFNWCEQSDCGRNCTCLEPLRVCKQACDRTQCGLLFCSSPLTCHQSVIKEIAAPSPVIQKMIAHSPRSEQECNKGRCGLLKALRYDGLKTTTFQSCADGNCDKLHSHADVAQQFCGNCRQMKCAGKHATNCTQYCVLGKCPDMTCNAKNCKQLCLHSSECTLTCGPNAKTCNQVCSHKSNCTMRVLNPHARFTQSCKHANKCTRVHPPPSGPRTTPTIGSTTPSTTRATTSTLIVTTTEMSNEVEVIDRDVVEVVDISATGSVNRISVPYRANSSVSRLHWTLVLGTLLCLCLSLLFSL